MEEREKLGSRLGFILISAGCAIGIGNVWKFPYLCGANGGGAFVLIYLLFLIILGIPVMTMEFAMGRAARKSPVKLYQEIEKPGSKWHLHGIVCMIGNILLMMYYTSVAGWMLLYFYKMATGTFEGLDADGIGAVFNECLSSPVQQVIGVALVVAIGFFVIMQGLQSGLERVTKVVMIALLVIMVILAGNSIFLEGGKEGLKFYLVPDFAKMAAGGAKGIFNVVVAAMNQAFFTLSLGIGAMAIFGSYIGKEHSLLGESVNVGILDTFVAIVSGLIIFPACFAYGVEPGAGPGLIFVTLPNIFNNMPMGRLWGSLFFVFMSFAAFSTVLAVFENIIACTMDLFGWERKKSCFVWLFLLFVLSLPCALGYSKIPAFPFRGGMANVLDLEDFIVSNLLLPGGSLIFVLFCTLKYGWGWDKFVAEANEGKGLKIASWMRPYMTYVLPLIVLAILIIGLI